MPLAVAMSRGFSDIPAVSVTGAGGCRNVRGGDRGAQTERVSSFSLTAPCPCGSGAPESRCCLPILRGEPADRERALAAYLRVDDATAEVTHEGWKRFLVLNMLAGFCVTQLVLWSVLVWA